MLILFILGLIGLSLSYFGIKLYLRKQHLKSLSLAIPGIVLVSFVFHNYIGYNQIFWKNEIKIIGKFKSEDPEIILDLQPDKTWSMLKGKKVVKSGDWEYIMSEDWCYWNLESKTRTIICQTDSPNTIQFQNSPFTFRKIKR